MIQFAFVLAGTISVFALGYAVRGWEHRELVKTNDFLTKERDAFKAQYDALVAKIKASTAEVKKEL